MRLGRAVRKVTSFHRRASYSGARVLCQCGQSFDDVAGFVAHVWEEVFDRTSR